MQQKEAHWGRDKNVRDVLIHLYEWHQLEYSWKTYGAMNVMFWNRHQDTSLEDAKKMFAESHAAVMALIESYSNEELFTPKYFAWTGNAELGAYCVSTTSSHYDWAIKKIKAHKKHF